MGKNKKNKKAKATRASKNKKAFDDIIGDPYALGEPIDGQYSVLKSRSSVIISDAESSSHSPVNQARPNLMDFACDVEAAVRDGLEVFSETNMEEVLKMQRFYFDNTYLFGSGVIFNMQERNRLEQIIGNILLQRGISPVQKYFTTIKR